MLRLNTLVLKLSASEPNKLSVTLKSLNRYVEKLEGTSRELEESREHFRHAAFHDALTGLPNRSLFTEHLKLALGRAHQNDDYRFCVLFSIWIVSKTSTIAWAIPVAISC